MHRIVLGLLLVLVLLGAFMGWQAWSAYRSAQAANTAIADFRAQLLDRDVRGAEKALARAQDETASARSSLGGPLWSGVATLPAVGDDVDAARRLTAIADDVAQGALPAVMTALSYVDLRDVGLRNGQVEIDPLREASGQLTRASVLLAAADSDASVISTDGLSGPLRSRVEDTQDLLGRTSRLARTASLAGRLLPDMLGGDGGRNYLLLAQNTAEQRSLGGIPGAIALLRARDGRVELVRQRTAVDIGTFQRPVLPLSKAEEALYGTGLGRYPANVTDSPDFPRAAELITEMWQRREGGRIDGVVSVDPWALQLLLRAVGPVQTDAGRLTGRNATQKLLVDVYREVSDPLAQDAVFAQAAQQAFEKVRQFAGDPRELTSALVEAVDTRRVMVWSAKRREQSILEDTRLGQTLRDPTPDSPRIGVYLHDRIGSKTSSYQRVKITTEPESCGTTTSARTRIELRSAVPRGAELPPSVTGIVGRSRPGDLRIQVVVYAPPGWSITGVRASDGRRDLITYKHDGLQAGTRDFTLSPGQTKDLTVTMGGQSLSSEFGIRYTPGTKPANVRVEGSGCT
ncbi:DUF4012 domain-containing protein [Nocardioides aurantiacus]|uniref:DUF4012 domain-containing protein n=1 Tax=Nocardioides aurantiacus TaxID=86796 RepID=UPI00403F4A2E